MSMSRKDYEAIARAIEYVHGTAEILPKLHKEKVVGIRHGAADAARRIADYLASDNPRFDRSRFLRACGISGE